MRGSTLEDGAGLRSFDISADAAALKISVSLRSARSCSFPRDRKGEAGARFISASVSILDASVVLLPEDLCGISMPCEKNSTVREILSALIFVMYTV